MKKLLFLIAAILFFQAAQAQLKGGVKIGLSTQDITSSDIATFLGPRGLDSLRVSATDAGYGAHFGGFLRFPVGPLFLEISPLLGSSRIDYTVEDVSNIQNVTSIVTEETFFNLDLPILIGIEALNLLRLQGGFVGSIVLNDPDNLLTKNGLGTTWNNLTWGYQLGVGVDLGKRLMLDVYYESNLTGLNDEITIGTQTFALDERPAKFIVTLGFPLGDQN